VTAFCIGGPKTPSLAFVMPRQSLQRTVAIPLRLDDGIREKYVPRVARQKVKSALKASIYLCPRFFFLLLVLGRFYAPKMFGNCFCTLNI